MSTLPLPKATRKRTNVFSALWTEELGAAIFQAAPPCGYCMSLVGADCRVVIAAVNQGIDARLEACFAPERGDRFNRSTADRRATLSPARLECRVSPTSLVVLVRRLMQMGDSAAESLAACVCQSLGIEIL